MKIIVHVLCTVVLLPFALSLCANPVVIIDHNGNDDAQADFHFRVVSAPRRSAANNAQFLLVDGNRDPNGGSLDVLHNGDLPTEDDQPGANFFFYGEGGRISVDLGKVIPVREIDTYSWHTGERAPQVYKLYGSDGGAPGFTPQPKRPQDPAVMGWKLLADVDTRREFKLAGGQYGVSVQDPAGIVGNYRYLLLDVDRTETNDAFGNTFFSEIAVLDRDAPAAPLVVAKTESHTYNENGLRLVFTSDDPKFDPAVRDALVKAFFATYPQMMKTFNPQAARNVRFAIENRFRGVAATAGTTIHANPQWFHEHPQDIDVITHEAMHVVQAYKQWDPAWLREGIADYARAKFGVNNPAAHWTMPDYDPKQNYTDAYRVTARFLIWLENHGHPGLAVAMDRALREGNYSADTWKRQTGKSVDELWQDYAKNPAL